MLQKKMPIARKALTTFVALSMVCNLFYTSPALAEEVVEDEPVVVEAEQATEEATDAPDEAAEAVPTEEEVVSDPAATEDEQPVEDEATETELSAPVEDSLDETLVADLSDEAAEEEAALGNADMADVAIELTEDSEEEEPVIEEVVEDEEEALEVEGDEESLESEAGTVTYNVTDSTFGANGKDTKADNAAINKATAKAKGNGGTVYIPSGTYYLDGAIAMYSGVTLKCAKDAKIIARFGKNSMVSVRHYNASGSLCPMEKDCTHGGYSQFKDITIEGGVWDRDPNKKFVGYNNSVFTIRHGQNLTIRNMTVMHSTNHTVNVSACKNVLIDNVTFKDNYKYTGKDPDFWLEIEYGNEWRFKTIEAVHTDFASPSGEVACYPFDNTPATDVTVKNCTFTNVYAGVGSHHISTKETMERITVDNCKFSGLVGACVNFFDAKDCSFTNSSASDAYYLVNISRSNDCKVINNKLSKSGDYGVRIEDSNGITVKDNNLYKAGAAGVRVSGKSTATVTGNTIKSAGTFGINTVTGAVVTCENNEITSPTKAGFVCEGATVKARKNKISGGETSISILDGSKGCVFESNTVTAPTGNAVYISASTGTSLKKNVISKAGKYGVFLTDKGTANIIGNEISASAADGIRFTSAGSGSTVSSNTIEGSKGTGVLVYNTQNIKLTSNTISDSASNGIGVLCDSGTKATATITGNTVASSGQNGIWVGDKSQASVTENTVVGSEKAGISVNTTIAGCTVTSNDIVGAKGKAVSITKAPSAKVSGNTEMKFKDVPDNHRFYDKIYLAVQNGIIEGYTGSKAGMFGPNDNIVRGQIAVILWRMAGKPAAGKNAKNFSDVTKGAYYYNAVRWASSTGVVAGYSNGKFGPNDNITREQLAVMICNYAKKINGISAAGSAKDYAKVSDHAKVSGYAAASVGWCYKKGIFVPESGKLNAKKAADRATAAQMAYDLYDLIH